MRIEVFSDLYDATQFLEVEAEFNPDFVSGELFKTEDGRFRVGINYTRQLELGLEDG